MADIFTTSLGHVQGAGNQDLVLTTTPHVGTIVLRDFIAISLASPKAIITLYWTKPGSSATFVRTLLGDGDLLHLDLRQVIPIDAELHVAHDAAGWSASCSGYAFNVSVAP